MLKILLVSRDKTSMSALKAGLEEKNVQTAWAESGSYALSMIAERDFDLVVTDFDSQIDPRFGRAAYILIIDTLSSGIEVLDNSENLNAFKGGRHSGRRHGERQGRRGSANGLLWAQCLQDPPGRRRKGGQ